MMLMAIAIGGLVICSLVVTALGTVWLGQAPEPASSEVALDTADGYRRSLEEALTANPDDAVALASLANLLATEGAHQEAVDYYERAIALEPENAGYRLDFALSLAEAGNRADAELQYERVLAAEPENAEALYFLGELYAQWVPPRRDEAVVAFERAIAADPESVSGEQAVAALARVRSGATPVSSR